MRGRIGFGLRRIRLCLGRILGRGFGRVFRRRRIIRRRGADGLGDGVIDPSRGVGSSAACRAQQEKGEEHVLSIVHVKLFPKNAIR